MNKQSGLLALGGLLLTGSVAFAALPGRMEYAVNFGKTDAAVGRFLPTGSSLWREGKSWNQLTANAVTAPAAYADEAAIYGTYVYPNDSTAALAATYVLPGLTPSAAYTLRLHVCEVYFTSAGQRTFDVVVNGSTVATAVDAYQLAGGKLTGAYLDLSVTADANGKLAIGFVNVANQFNIAALEVFSSAEGLPVPVPTIRREASGVNIVTLETRHAAYRYDVEYREGASGVGRVLATGASGLRVVDACGTAMRQYRARTVSGDTAGDWSDWTAVDAALRPSDASFFVTCANPDQSAPDGWLKDVPFRVFPDNLAIEYKTWWKAFDLTWFPEAERPPLLVFQLALDASAKPLAYRFPGLDPKRKYRVRIHQMEPWEEVTSAGWRVYAYHFNGDMNRATALTSETQVDPYVLADNAVWKAAAVDYVVRPDCAGSILVAGENIESVPYWFGFEIHPLDEDYVAPGRIAAAFYANAQADGEQAADVVETLATNTALPTLRVTAADLPAACAGSLAHLYAHGKVHVPTTGNYAFSVSGQGHLSLFADGTVLVKRRDLDGTAFVTDPVALSAGEHILYADLRQTDAAAFALSVEVASEPSGTTPSLSSVLSPAPTRADFGSWKRYVRGPLAKNYMPSYVVPTADDGRSFRIYGSGDNMWSSDDTGTMLVRTGHPANRPYRLLMRIKDVGYGNASTYDQRNTRAGALMTSWLGGKTVGGLFLFSGWTYYGNKRYSGFYDSQGPTSASLSITTDHKESAAYQVPVWVKSEKTRIEGGKWRYEQSYSLDGSDWSLASRHLDYSRADITRPDCAGPIVVVGQAGLTTLSWMDVDNLAFEDTAKQGMAIIFR